MNEQGSQPKKRSWVKIGCLAIVGIFAAMIALGMIIQAFDPEGVERRAAEMKARHAQQAAADAAAEKEARLAAIGSATRVTSLQLSTAYQNNEVAAQQLFGDRPLLVTGTVTGVRLNFADEPVVELNSVNEFLSVQADLADANAAAGLRKGQKVTLLCQKVTEVVSAPMLADCELIE